MGDPLIRISAPRDAICALAVLPSGELMPLRWNADTHTWEARFDVPTWATPGDHIVQIIVVFHSGTRQKLVMHFVVDTQTPTGKASEQGGLLRVETDALTDRVSAFLKDGSRLELQRDHDGVFTSPVSPGDVLRVVLTDKAHNRLEIVLEP